MRWGIRVATDREAGGGHAVRCAALARALASPVTVFADPDQAALDKSGAWPSRVVGERGRESADAARSAFRSGEIDALIFDSYWIAEGEIDDASEIGFTAVFRDGERPGKETIVIDPRPEADVGRRGLAGSAYMPLPSRFADLHDVARGLSRRSSGLLRVLVTFGHRDSVQRTLCAVEALSKVQAGIEVTAILGPDYSEPRAVHAIAADDNRFEIQPAPDDLVAVFKDYDLSIGAPGVTQFERACCGLPAILIAQNDRQVPLSQAWDASGAAMALRPDVNEIASAVGALAQDRERLAIMRAKGLDCVDGRGAQRLADALNQKVEARTR